MDIITIACPVALPCEYLSDSSPIWVDASGNQYKVASGIFDVDIPEATSDVRLADNTLQIVISSSGLGTLAAMGLTPE